MSSSERTEYTFTCPECDEALEVNHSMKVALVEMGCVICGASVTGEAFTSSTDSTYS